jgi:short-subunit dehydrogenase
VLPADLATASGAESLLAQVAARGLAIETLVNNAGFGGAGAFVQQDEAELLAMVEVNINALVLLTRRLLPEMLARKRGHVLNVASTAGFQPGPWMATYYATKAFVLSFSEALRRELRGTGVSVTTLCPGPTHTGFQRRAGVETSPLFRPANLMDAGSVADAAVSRLDSGGLVVPGLANKLLVQLLRVAPRRAVLELISQLNKARAA